MLNAHEVLRGRAPGQAGRLWECSHVEREGEGHWHRGTAGATAGRLEVQGGSRSLWINGGFLVGLELQFAGGWKGGSCVASWSWSLKIKVILAHLLQNPRTQEIIFKKEVQSLR